jgi:RNA polymerase subunit RPABC4/transcription elongation factor Spt4
MSEKAVPRKIGEGQYICPLCKAGLQPGEEKCPACGTEFDWSEIC